MSTLGHDCNQSETFKNIIIIVVVLAIAIGE